MEKPMLGEDPWIFLFWEEISKKTIKKQIWKRKSPVFLKHKGFCQQSVRATDNVAVSNTICGSFF